MTYFPVHAHTQFSGMDGMNKVQQAVDRVVELGQPGLAFTEHGNMAGVVQGYKACAKAGIKFFPGTEAYIVRDHTSLDTRATRYHVGLLALDEVGYRALVALSSLSWSDQRFYYKPLIDLADLARLKQDGMSDHIALLTGCYSGIPIQTLLQQGRDAAKRMILMYSMWFPNTTYVELQNHGIQWTEHLTSDDQIMGEMYDIAQELGLPVVFGADSHYIHPAQQPVHDLMKDICYFGAGEDMHFSGGPYHLMSQREVGDRLAKRMRNDVWAGHDDLLAKHQVRIPPLDTFKFQVPKMFKDADLRLETACWDWMKAQTFDNNTRYRYDERLTEELHVIRTMGMANYHLLVKTHITDWCRAEGIVFNTRGSANGSLVCHALGITNVDPIKWGTSFERYLSLVRIKPPDIDIDVDFQGRVRVVEHLRAVFPTMVQVGTYAKIGMGKAKDGSENGSVIVQYMAAMRKKHPDTFAGKIAPEHKQPLYALAETPVFKSLGTNAAGFVLPGDHYPIGRWLPLARVISSDTTVTQFYKSDVEDMGYLKIDLLGSKTLQTMNGVLVRLGKTPNDWSWIPDDDRKALGIIQRGQTEGVFQYEGYTQRRGGMEMKCRSTLEVILGTALYRPALTNGGQKDKWLHNRKVQKAYQQRLHQVFDPVLNVTHGVPLYQEQIMQMLQVIGMNPVDYNDLMTAVKQSNEYVVQAAQTFQRLLPTFYDLCEDHAVEGEDADAAWHAIVGFTEYGFNRAHSTAYGLMAYWSAYLKAHHPKEFMASLLSVWSTDKDKTREYTSEARRLGFSIIKPDVNISALGWIEDPRRPNALRKGLVAIPGIGDKAAGVILAERDANGPFASIEDFISRLPARPVSGGKDYAKTRTLNGVCKTLDEAGAFRSLIP